MGGAKDGRLTVKCLYNTIVGDGIEAFPSNVIWNSWVPPKVGIFAWEAAWCKILTLDKLQRRG